MKKIKKFWLLGLVMLVALPVYAQDWAGKVTDVEGQVKVMHAGASIPAKAGTPVMAGDEIVTGPNSKVKIYFRDESVITLAPNSRFRVDALEYNPGQSRKSVFSLLAGKARASISGWFSKTPEQDYQIKALSTVAGVRGTEVIIQINGEGVDANALFAGLSGTITLWSKDNPDKKISLPANFFLSILNGGTPGNPQPLTPELLLQLLEGLGFEFGSRDEREEWIVNLGFFYFPGGGGDHVGEGGELTLVFTPGDGDNNSYLDPSAMIFQEPPGFTAVSIIINDADLKQRALK